MLNIKNKELAKIGADIKKLNNNLLENLTLYSVPQFLQRI